MQTRIQRIDLPADSRLLMISDIHAHADGLRDLLQQAGFGGNDVLIIVGDIVEKGPASLETLRLVMQLTKTHTVYPLMGNVDLWRMQCLLSEDPKQQQELVNDAFKACKWWNTSFLSELLGEMGLKLTQNMDTQAVFSQLRVHFAEEFSFLMGLPTILETQDMIFVHGGIPHERLDELTDAYPLLKRDRFLEEGLVFQKTVVTGHWPVTLYASSCVCSDPLICREQNIICLDGGCGLQIGGQLNLLIRYPSGEYTLCRWNGLPQATALDPQMEKTDFTSIRWGRELQRLEVLEQLDDGVRAVYQGRELIIPEDFLIWKEGVCFCDGFTDYRPSILPGDQLSIVMEKPFGRLIKKGGITGWYSGRLAP